MSRRLPFQDADPASRDFQYLEDLSIAYWYSEVLFAALELRLFELLETGCTLADLALASGCREDDLRRLLRVLERLDLVHQAEGAWFNSQACGRFLVPGSPSYMGNFLLYRRRMQQGWRELAQRLAPGRPESTHYGSPEDPLHPQDGAKPHALDDDYDERTFHYVRAMDELLRQKADEIAALLSRERWEPPILDAGGGAGALGRALIRSKGKGHAALFELPEVIRAAKCLYPDNDDPGSAWGGPPVNVRDKPSGQPCVRSVEGDFRTREFQAEDRFGLILLSNFLHAYGPTEARDLLHKAVDLLLPDGLLLIHDYFPDRPGRSPHKGPFYDLNMMLNTFDGACHETTVILEWLSEKGMDRIQVRDLTTDSAIILATRGQTNRKGPADLDEWAYAAREAGFRRGVLIRTSEIVIAPWVRLKCKCGCPGYGKNLQCPPHSMDSPAMKELLQSYTLAVLLEGTPPGRDFHAKLLRLERRAFLAGYYKALVFGAGPCPVCKQCPAEGTCLHPDQARPSMEASGIDVYATARKAGIELQPVTDKGDYVKYIGLLLLE